MTKLKIAVIQMMCRPYRARFFGELAKVKEMEFTFLFGKPPKQLEHQALSKHEEISRFRFNYEFLPSVGYQGEMPTTPFHWKRSLTMFPTLLFRILRGRYEVIVAEGGLFLDFLPLLVGCKLTKTSLIVWSAGNIRDNIPKSKDSLIKKILYAFIRHVYQRCNAAIAYGSGTKEFLVFLGINPRKIFVATNTIDNFFFEEISKMKRGKIDKLRRELHLQNKKVVLYVGSIERRKKLEILINAFEGVKATLPETSLLVLGDGPDKDRLVELCNNKGLENDIKFLGKVDYFEVPLYYFLSDVFVLPSQGGITVMEAIASGKPVIVSEECNGLYQVPGIVRPEENGFIVRKDDSHAIEKYLHQLLTEEEMAAEMGKKSKEMALNLFSVDKMVRGFVEAIESCFK